MGLILNREMRTGCKMGLWEINESYDELRAGLQLESEEVKTLEGFRNHERKLEWLSVRNLINEIRGEHSRIIYNADRKPFLLDNSSNISISGSWIRAWANPTRCLYPLDNSSMGLCITSVRPQSWASSLMRVSRLSCSTPLILAIYTR